MPAGYAIDQTQPVDGEELLRLLLQDRLERADRTLSFSLNYA